MKKRILGILLSLIMAVGMLPTMAMAQEPAPTFNLEKDLKDITIPEHLVTCICITTGESKPYGQLTGGFTTDGKVIKKNGEWTVIVRIYKKTYMEKFNTDTGTTHSPKQNDSSDFTTPIQFELKHNGEKWELMDQIPTGTELHFTCDGKHKPSVPMFSNITDISEKLVAVSCTNVSGGPSGEFYGLIDGAFTATEPILNSDGVYESTITLNAKEYLKKFNTDTGILHSLVSEVDTEGKKIDPVFVVKYDHDRRMWVPKEATKNLIIFVNCEKHETQPQPPVIPVYPPSGGGSTIYPGGTPGGNGTIVNPDNNQGNQQPTVDSKDKQGNNKTKKIKKSDTMEKVPKTGDNTAMTIWLVLLLLSVGALFGTVAFDRKRKRI